MIAKLYLAIKLRSEDLKHLIPIPVNPDYRVGIYVRLAFMYDFFIIQVIFRLRPEVFFLLILEFVTSERFKDSKKKLSTISKPVQHFLVG